MSHIEKIKKISTKNNVTCYVCNGNNWSVEEYLKLLSKIESKELGTQPNVGLVIAMMSCNNCGHIMMFDEKLLLQSS